MDRRFKEAKGASKAGLQKSEAITRSTTRKARVQAHGAKQYGGSTGGRKSIAGGTSKQSCKATMLKLSRGQRPLKSRAWASSSRMIGSPKPT